MENRIEFFGDQCFKHGLTFDLYYSSIVDWWIIIGYKATHPKCNEILFQTQSCDASLALSKAEVFLKEWLLENKGGY